MEGEPPTPNPDPSPSELAETRIPPQLAPSEKEVFEGKIIELKGRVAELEEEIAQLKKPKAAPKKKSIAERFSPL